MTDPEDRQALKESTYKEERIKKFRQGLVCQICPPNQGENASRKPKHGVKKPKGKRGS